MVVWSVESTVIVVVSVECAKVVDVEVIVAVLEVDYVRSGSLNSADSVVLAGGEVDPMAAEYAGILCDPVVEGPEFSDYSDTGECTGVTDAGCVVKALGLCPHPSIGLGVPSESVSSNSVTI